MFCLWGGGGWMGGGGLHALPIQPPHPPKDTKTVVQKALLKKCASCRGNIEYVESWGGMLNQNVLLSGEMLNMLNMLNALGRTWPNPPPFLLALPKPFNIFNISAVLSNMPPQDSTYSTVPLKEAHY